jgi:hypothetical protein
MTLRIWNITNCTIIQNLTNGKRWLHGKLSNAISSKGITPNILSSTPNLYLLTCFNGATTFSQKTQQNDTQQMTWIITSDAIFQNMINTKKWFRDKLSNANSLKDISPEILSKFGLMVTDVNGTMTFIQKTFKKMTLIRTHRVE